MARLPADSPGRHTTRQATYLLFTLTLAGVVLLWATAAMQAEAGSQPPAGPATDSAPEVQFNADPGALPGLIEAPSRVDFRSPEQRLGNQALQRLSYPWQERLGSDWEIAFLPERDGLYGLTIVSEKRVEVYVRLERSVEFLTHVIAHELGHAVDVTLNSGDDRGRWRDQRDLGTTPWWPNNASSDFSTGAGDFAESFAAWQAGDAYYRSELAQTPSRDDLALLAELAQG